MKLIWTIDIKDENYFQSNHSCKPIIWQDNLFYAFITLDKLNIDESKFYGAKIVVFKIDFNTKSVSQKSISFSYNKKKSFDSTKDWIFFTENDNLMLYVGLTLNVSKSEIIIAEDKQKFEKFSIKHSYSFDDKRLNHNQRSTLECFDSKNNQLIWKQNLKGYLYTYITKKENLIFFGTAGKGGAFYCINIDNGKILVEFNNGDASEFAWSKNNIIIKDKKGNLVKLNPVNGEIIETLKLKEKIYPYAPIYLNDSKIFTRVYNDKEKLTKLIYIDNTD